MRVDYLLSHLLFGMTLLTCLTAVAHLVGDKVARAVFPSRPRARGWTQRLVLGLAITAALALMISRFDEGERQARPDDWDRERVAPRPVARGLGLVAAELPRSPAAEPPDESFTLLPEPTEEATSGLAVAREALARFATVRSFIDAASADDCKSWKFALEDARISAPQAPPAALGSACAGEPGCFLLVCLSQPLREDHEEALARNVERGASVLFVGRPREAGAFPAVRRLLRVRAWKSAEAVPRPASLVFGGSLLGYGGVPAGLRIVLGRDWQDAPGAPLAEGQGEVALLAGRSLLELDHRASPLVARTVGAGRAAWTSLPPRLYDRLEALHGPSWSLFVAHLLGHLARVPLPGFEPMPQGARSGLVVPAVHVEHAGGETKEIARVLQAAGAPAGYFWVMSEALEHDDTFRGLRAGGAEIGASDLDHQGRADAAFYEVTARLRKWRRTYDKLAGDKSGGRRSRAGCCEIGAWVPPARAVAPATYAALIGAGFDFAIGDPFTDMVTPYRLTVTRTASLYGPAPAAEVPATTSSPGSGALVVLPVFAADDYAFLSGNTLLPDEEIDSAVMSAHATARWLGAPLCLRVHSQVLGSPKGRPTLERVLQGLRRQGVQFLSPRSYISFWDARSRISQRLETEGPEVLRLELLSVGERAFEGGVIRIPEPDRWRLEEVPAGWEPVGNDGGDPASYRLYLVPRIDPGQSVALRLRRLTRTSSEVARPRVP